MAAIRPVLPVGLAGFVPRYLDAAIVCRRLRGPARAGQEGWYHGGMALVPLGESLSFWEGEMNFIVWPGTEGGVY